MCAFGGAEEPIAVIVTCHQCATQFHLDDAKVPPEGIRVRCSRCKFAFMVESPQQAPADHGESVAAEAHADAPAAGAPAAEKDPGESDWEFSVDIAAGAAEEGDTGASDAAAAAVDDLLGGVESPPAASETPPQAGASSKFVFESSSVAGFDDGEGGAAYEIDTETVEHDLGGSDVDFSTPSKFDEVDLGGEIESEPPDDVHADLSIAADPPVETPDETSALPPAAPWEEPDSASALADASEEEPTPRDEAAETGAAEDAGAANDAVAAQPPWAVEAPIDVDVDSAIAAPRWATVARSAAGWTVVTALCVTALALGLVPSAPSASSEAVVRTGAGLEAHALEGKWIDNSVAGPIYAISGALRSGGEAPTAALPLRVFLVDTHGDPVSAESAAIGPPLPTRDLREADPRDLRERLERGAGRFAAKPLAPGDRRPFHAIFERVPPSAAAFVIRAAEDTPAPSPEDGFSDLAPDATPAP